MNTYKFLLKDYKAIKEANIELNGITVLAGENGSGKSTITRWFYYLIEVIAKYDKFAYEDLCDDIFDILKEYRVGFRYIQKNNNSITQSINKWRFQTKLIDYSIEENIIKIIDDAKDIIIRIFEFLKSNSEDGHEKDLLRSLMYLGIDNVEDLDCDLLMSENLLKIETAYKSYNSRISERSIGNIFKYLSQHYDETLKRPNLIQLNEDNTPILGENVAGYLLGLQRAIYVDTPMAVVNEVMFNKLWENLQELLQKTSGVKLSLGVKKMLLRIQKLIHGSIKYNDDDFDNEMHYVREDNLDIPLSEAATGIKSFACIIRLLENGYLDKNTLLIIDEPEAHLHPQWIVEYARILVLLSKELGVRILIASHNPDMVAAIQAIGEKEGLKERITFYQAIPADTMYQYEYKNLGFEVTEIFKSFNIALSRIQDYGRIDN